MLKMRTLPPMRCVPVDWSGKLTGAEQSIWLAEVRDGRLLDLDTGFTRSEVVQRVVALAEEETRLVVGFDFAFSFPAWWCREQGWDSARDVRAAMAASGEALLAACEPPLWGRPADPTRILSTGGTETPTNNRASVRRSPSFR